MPYRLLSTGAQQEDMEVRLSSLVGIVEASARRFSELGTRVSTISIPWHRDGIHIWNGIAVEGATMVMIRGNSMGTN
jgi:hypothetical protein